MPNYIMMKSLYLFTIFIFAFSCLLSSSNVYVKPKTDANVTGHVVDAKTKEHLPYITIAVKGTSIGTVTDATGHYLLKDLPLGELVLVVSSVGYEKIEKKVTTKANTLLEVNFELREDATLLNEVVVSATRNATNKKEAPVIVNIASAKLFESIASSNLTEAMNFQPGVRIENNCGNCGTTQLRINGLEGQYTQILLDSRPIFTSLAGVYGLEQLPVGMIERVEVIRGGGSALFGASAIGGVVNIITKDPIRNSVTMTNTTNIFKDGKLDINTALNASYISDDHKVGVYLFGMLKNRNAYDHNDDGFSDVPKINAETVGFRGFYRTSNFSRLVAEYHHIHEFRRGGNAFSKPPHEADVAEQLDRKIDGGGLRFNLYSPDEKHRMELFTSGQLIRRDSYFGIDQNPDAYGNTEDKTFVAGGQYTLKMNKLLFAPAELTTGAEYSYNNLHDTFSGLGRNLKQHTTTVGGYLQNEWKVEKFSLLLGARIDKHNLMDNVVFSPRANVRYSPIENIGLRASYSSGYRPPQAYNEDLHVEAVGGSLSMITLADGLKPEYSHSLSASADLYHRVGIMQFNLLVEGFYTLLDDVFTLSKIGTNDDESIVYWERRNGDGAKVRGLNFEGRLVWPDKWDLQFGYTLQLSKYNTPHTWSDDLPAQRKMFRAPGNYGYFTSEYSFTRAFKGSLFGNYTGSMRVQHTVNDGITEEDLEKDTRDFIDMGVKVSYSFNIGASSTIEISGGVKNFLNAFQKDLDYGMLKDASYVYGPAAPRQYFVGVKISL